VSVAITDVYEISVEAGFSMCFRHSECSIMCCSKRQNEALLASRRLLVETGAEL
jgi:hypothetical protein